MSDASSWRETLVGEAETVAFGERLGDELFARGGDDLVFLHGELGAGKTTLVRGVLRSMGHSGAVKSPTYTLLEPYTYGDQTAYHFDLYRISDPDELGLVGFDEIIDGAGLKLVEWPERADDWLPSPSVDIHLSVQRTDGVDSRQVVVEFSGNSRNKIGS